MLCPISELKSTASMLHTKKTLAAFSRPIGPRPLTAGIGEVGELTVDAQF